LTPCFSEESAVTPSAQNPKTATQENGHPDTGVRETVLIEAQRSFDRSLSILNIIVMIAAGLGGLIAVLIVVATYLNIMENRGSRKERERITEEANKTLHDAKAQAQHILEAATKEAERVQEIRKKTEVYYYLQQASDYWSRGEYDSVLRELDRAINIEPLNLTAWLLKDDVFQILGRDKERLEAFDKLIEINPKFISFWITKGQVLHNLERDEEALRAYDEALGIDPRSCNALNGKGNSFVKLRKYDKAKAAFKEALGVDSRYAPGRYNLATVYSLESRKNEALSNLEEAIKIDPAFKKEAKRDSYFNEIREDENFKRLVE